MKRNKKKITKYQKAFKIVTNEIKKDSELYYAYQSNIAMAFLDKLQSNGYKIPNMHQIANDSAIYFLNNLCNMGVVL